MVQSACKKEQIEQADYCFSRRDIREFTDWSDSQLKTHCGRLTDMEYLIVHRGGRGQSIVYELAFDGMITANEAHMMGLIDVKQLYDNQKSGQSSKKSASSLGQVCPKSGGGLGSKNGSKPNDTNGSGKISKEMLENVRLASKKTNNNHVVHA